MSMCVILFTEGLPGKLKLTNADEYESKTALLAHSKILSTLNTDQRSTP